MVNSTFDGINICFFTLTACVSLMYALYLTAKILLKKYPEVYEKFKSRTDKIYDNKYFYIAVYLSTITFVIFIYFRVNVYFSFAICFLLFIFTPQTLLKHERKKYLKEFDDSLILGLTAISTSLRAGSTLKSSLENTLHTCPKILTDQIKLTLQEHALGVSLDDAVVNLRLRVNSNSSNIAFGALMICNKIGGNLPEILKKIVTNIQETNRVNGKLKALTAQGRTQALILCSAPLLIWITMYLWDPSKAMLLTNTTKGQILLCLAITLELIGIAITKKIVKLEI